MSFSLIGLGRQEMQSRQKTDRTGSGKTGMLCANGYRSRSSLIRLMQRSTASCKRSKRTWSRCSTVARGTMTRICCSPTWLTIYSMKRRTSRQARKARQAMSNPRVCKDCGGKESDIIPFYDNRHERICTKCLSIRNKNKYAEEKREKEKRKEIVSQPVSSECVKLPSANPTEVTRYNAIHALSDKAKKEARGRVVDALMEYFAGKDKSTVTQRD